MSIIIVKGRREPIEIEKDRAKLIKARWLGIDGQPKADPEDILDLGDMWTGQYKRIDSIELNPVFAPHKKNYAEVMQEEAQKEAAQFYLLTPDQKASNRENRIRYVLRVHFQFSDEMVDQTMQAAKKIVAEYFTQYKNKTTFPKEILQCLQSNSI